MKSKISLRKKKGFTLMEMLIVVAIIAILIAIAIPIFNTQLEKARVATDNANLRSAKSLAVATYLTGDYTSTGDTFYFDANNGTLTNTDTDPAYKYGKSSTVKDSEIVITIAVGGANSNTDTITVQWKGKTGTTPDAKGLLLSYSVTY